MKASVQFLHKKGSKEDPNNYRCICIQNAFLKVFGKLISKRINSFLESNNLIPQCQFGFRKDLSTLGALTILHELVTYNLEKKNKVYAAFIDLKKAFNSIQRSKLQEKMSRAGFPKEFTNLILRNYNLLMLSVRIGDANYGQVPTSIGLPQGENSSPLLYNLFTADLPEIFEGMGAEMNGNKIPLICYADDLAVLANTPEELQMMLDKLCKYFKDNGLTMNTGKTKIMCSFTTSKQDFYFCVTYEKHIC